MKIGTWEVNLLLTNCWHCDESYDQSRKVKFRENRLLLTSQMKNQSHKLLNTNLSQNSTSYLKQLRRFLSTRSMYYFVTISTSRNVVSLFSYKLLNSYQYSAYISMEYLYEFFTNNVTTLINYLRQLIFYLKNMRCILFFATVSTTIADFA